MAVERTPEQEAVVANRGGSLLVSAAAGSGKTRVLVERLLDRILTEGKNMDEFLIITYTRAAASELRARIGGELSQRLRAQPGNAHLREQISRLYQTQISTIHSFCAVLLRQWGHLLDVPGDFALCEEEEAAVLKARTLEQLLESRYEELRPGDPFARLVDILAGGRDDSRLAGIALDLYEKLQSAPDPAAWLERQRTQLELSGVTDAGQTVWGERLLEEAAQTASYWAEQMTHALALCKRDGALEKAYSASLAETVRDLERYALAAGRSWDETAGCVITFPRFGGARGVEDLEAQQRINSIRERCKKAVKALQTSVSGSSGDLLEDMALVRPAMTGLIDLVRDFTDVYGQEKRKRSMLDFSDLEHLAGKLLTDSRGKPTEIARTWGGQYTEIMVDEYQDTNQVQNLIFQAVSDEGRNLFMVGDVKQSIYRFRLADPTIFLKKYRSFPPWTEAEEGGPRLITMSKNFRSRPEVLEAANDLFRNIMSEDLGELAYTDAEALYPGGRFPEGEGYETELHVLDFSEDPLHNEEKQSTAFLEARFAAKQIRAMVTEGFAVSDGEGGLRPLQPDDVAILLRSPKSVRRFYIQALEEQGLGWTAEEGENFFQTTEISAALAWLQIIDNPRQDIPLLAALRSPVCGFTADRLAEIRTRAERDFYDAVLASAELGEEDCRSFLEELELLRGLAREESSYGLLRELYRRLDFLEIFSAMAGGEKRRENLLAFYDLACRFESAGHRGLFSFLLHLDRLQEHGGPRSAASPPGEKQGVRIMSIHASKGLEFPVVFLCGLGRKFNRQDQNKPVLFHPILGLGPRGLDPETMVQFSTVAHAGVSLALKKEMLAEEMRLLYVAMTRAKEKLVMIHTLARGRSELRSLADAVSVPADPRVLAASGSAGQWVILTALARPEAGVLREAAGMGSLPGPAGEFGPPWRIEYHAGAVSQEVRRRRQTDPRNGTGAPDPAEVVRRLTWRYRYEKAAQIPAKVTATQVDSESEEAGVFLLRERGETERLPFHRPDFAQKTLGLTPAQEGTALHTVMQGIRLDRTGSEEAVRSELTRLSEEGFLTRQQADSVEPELVVRFFASEYGKGMRESASLNREYPFSLLVDAVRFYPDAPEGEKVLLQGVIDVWYRDENGITLLDFKSDRVSAGQIRERAEAYRGQLAAYAHALEILTGERVFRRVIWFLRPGRDVLLQD